MLRRTVLPLLAALALFGCSAQKSATPAATAGARPQEMVLTNQTLTWECPQCGMDYDRAGQCPMCKADLVATNVAYICPADQKPVEKAGQCPRCNVNARVVKTAAVPAPPTAQ